MPHHLGRSSARRPPTGVPGARGTAVPAGVLDLQAAAGNAAVARLLSERGPRIAVQRDVGFEFETNWQLRHVVSSKELRQWTAGVRKAEREQSKEAKKLERERRRKAKRLGPDLVIGSPSSGRAVKEQDKEKELEEEEQEKHVPTELPEQEAERVLPGRDLAKGDRVVLGDGFDLTADTTPSGGAEIEFVTLHFPETHAGRQRLDAAMLGMTRMGQRLVARGGQKSFPAGVLNGLGTVGSGFEDVAVFPYGPLTANPQTTTGIRLDQVPDLLNVMRGREVQGVTRRPGIDQTLLSADADVMADAGDRARQACGDLPDNALADDRRRALEGLLTLVLSYLLMGHKKYKYRGVVGPLSISKSIAPLMARTNFAVMFDQVFPTTDDFIAVFGKGKNWVSFVLDAAGLPDGPVFEHGFYKTQLVDGRKKEVLQKPESIGLDREAWIRGICVGVDLMTKFMTPIVHKSLGSLSRGETVGPAAAPAQGAIIEWRRMTGTVPYDQWRTLALGVFDLVSELHRRR